MKCSTNTNSCNNNCELVEILGLCNPSDVNQVINEYPYWKQMYLTETLVVPEEKPDIEVINSVDISVNIMRADVIRTPRTYTTVDGEPVPVPNLEGKILTGRKLIIEGVLCQQIEYTADETTQPVHSAHFYVPFSSFIVVPETIPFTDSQGNVTDVDSLDVVYEVNACVEDVSVKVINPRTILKQVTLLLYAVPTQAS